GTTTSSSIYFGGEDTMATIEIFSDDDCYGTDTISIAIPPVPVIDLEAFQPCGDGATGSIVISPISGITPFSYSIDGAETFQEATYFDGLNFGDYLIWVKDSLGCLYEFDAVIDHSSSLPTPQ